ncbi:energy-coupling factor transporter transmembrane protein EcfT [Candidatus Micrarchaeota archaeon]|nr:energy-coupling factor transporter transmembrane protein EcfT [Candidatus Micrarchaeota archaeon]
MISFIPKSSPIHRIDARVKLLYLLSFLTILIVKQSLPVLIIFSLLTLLLYITSSIPLTQPLRDLGAGWIFVFLPVPLHMLINLQTGLYYGAISSVFTLNLILLSLLGIYTTDVESILQALVFLKVPSELAFMLTVSIRFLPVVQERLNQIRISQAVRGYELAPFSLPIPLIVPLLHSSLKRAEELAISLESRGFDPENIHIHVNIRLGPVDYLLLLLLPLLFSLVF